MSEPSAAPDRSARPGPVPAAGPQPTPTKRIRPATRDDHRASALRSGGLRSGDGLAQDTPPRSLTPRSSRLFHPLARLGLLILTLGVVGGAVLVGGSIALAQVMDPATASSSPSWRRCPSPTRCTLS